MTTTLVLGVTGFIGGHTALCALEQGWRVRGLRRRQGAEGLVEDERIEWFEGDLDMPETLPAAFRGVDVVFHAAGYFPRHSKDTPAQVAHAVQQTRNVLDAAVSAGVSRLVYTSSLTTIGRPARGEARLADERDHYLPGTVSRSAYYECKYAMESEVLRAVAAGVPAIVVIPTAVFGPGDLHRRTGAVLLAVARGGVPVWIPGDLNVVDVREVAMAQVRAGEVGRSGERYILGGHNLRLVEFLKLAAELAGVRPPRVGLPLWSIDLFLRTLGRLSPFGLVSNHLWGLRHWQPLDCSKAKRELGLRPRPLYETLTDALNWYRTHEFLTR